MQATGYSRVPANDRREHINAGVYCWCQPLVEEVDGEFYVTHFASDGREFYEAAERELELKRSGH